MFTTIFEEAKKNYSVQPSIHSDCSRYNKFTTIYRQTCTDTHTHTYTLHKLNICEKSHKYVKMFIFSLINEVSYIHNNIYDLWKEIQKKKIMQNSFMSAIAMLYYSQKSYDQIPSGWSAMQTCI